MLKEINSFICCFLIWEDFCDRIFLYGGNMMVSVVVGDGDSPGGGVL